MVLLPQDLEADLLSTVWREHHIPEFAQILLSRFRFLFVLFVRLSFFFFLLLLSDFPITYDLDPYIGLITFQAVENAVDVYPGPLSSSQHVQDQSLTSISKQGVHHLDLNKCYLLLYP